MSMMETSEARQQIERWIEESQLLLGRTIPGVLEDNQRLRDKLAGAEEDSDRMREELASLRRELGALQSDLEALRGQHEYLKAEQASRGGGAGPGRSSYEPDGATDQRDGGQAARDPGAEPGGCPALIESGTPPVPGLAPGPAASRGAAVKMLKSSPVMNGVFAAQYDALFRRPWPVWGAAVLVATVNVFLFAFDRPWTASDGMRNWGDWLLTGRRRPAPPGSARRPGSIRARSSTSACSWAGWSSALLSREFAIRVPPPASW